MQRGLGKQGAPGKPPPVLDTDGNGDDVIYYQTGLFATGSCDATFKRLIFRGFTRKDGGGNYAAIRLGQAFRDIPRQGVITLEDCEVSGCNNGIITWFCSGTKHNFSTSFLSQI